MSPVLNEKIISSKANPSTEKKIRSANVLVEADNKIYAENIIKMKTFHKLKCKTYPHEMLNTSKGIIRNRELSLTTSEVIKTAFIYLPTPPLGQDMTQGQFLSGV